MFVVQIAKVQMDSDTKQMHQLTFQYCLLQQHLSSFRKWAVLFDVDYSET